jgi:polyphosphate kinase
MTQTQPQHQPPAQPAPPLDIQVTGAADAEAEAEQVEHPVPPTYQQIEAFGYQRFTNREQSRLDFAARLLDLAEDDGQPLLERVKFVAIFSELLDEFYQIRVAALEDQVAAGCARAAWTASVRASS